MLNNRPVSYVFGAILIALTIIGCSEDAGFASDLKSNANPLELALRIKGKISVGKPMLISEMSPEDAIVVVNGYPLTKKTYDDILVLKAKGLSSQKGANSLVVDKMVDQFRRSYIRAFVSQRLMIDNALSLGVVTTNDVNAHLNTILKKQAESTGKTVDAVLKSFGKDRRYVLYEMAVAYVMNELVKAKIPPKTTVNDEFVAAFQKQVALENETAQKSNEVNKVTLLELRRQILEKKIDFATAAAECSQDIDLSAGIGKDGEWGEFEEGEMDDRTIEAAVFAMKRGEISDVLEDENGLHLVKVLSITPPEKNEKGRVIKRERRKLAHIYIEKVPLLIRQDNLEMEKDLKNQMLMQAINDYVGCLATNGVNTIVFPHGTRLHE